MKMLNNNIRRFIREEKVNKRNVTVFILLVVKFAGVYIFMFKTLWNRLNFGVLGINKKILHFGGEFRNKFFKIGQFQSE